MNTKINVRKNSRHFVLSGVLLIVVMSVSLLLFKGLGINPNVNSSPLIGKSGPDFNVKQLQNENGVVANEAPLSLSKFKGKKVVLNFWASWCVSCREEARSFEAYWQTVKAKNIAVVGIAIQDTPEAALEFARAFGKTYILGLDVDGKASMDYGVTGVPETFLIDENGVIVHREVGPMTVKMLQEKFGN